MCHHKRKRDAIEESFFRRDVRIKLTPSLLKSTALAANKVTFNSFFQNKDNGVTLKKGAINTTFTKSAQDKGIDQEINTKNRLLRKLLELEDAKAQKDKNPSSTEEAAKRKNSQEQVDLAKEGRKLIEVSGSEEKNVGAAYEKLVRANQCLDELTKLEETGKEKLRNIMISKMTLGAEMQTRLDFMREALHETRLNLSNMQKAQVEKRKVIKTLSDNVTKIKASGSKADLTFTERSQRLGELRVSSEKSQAEISEYKERLCEVVKKVNQLNHEYFKENNIVRVLKEQIHCVKGGAKVIGLTVPINHNSNPFEYETYFKLTNTHTISLINSDKFITKSNTGSGSPKRRSLGSSYGPSSFSFDHLIHESRGLGFYNYDYHQRLYAEIELFIKLSLYGDDENLLSKLGSNRLDYKRLLGIDKLTKYFNIDPAIGDIEEVRRKSGSLELEMGMTLIEKNSLLRSTMSSVDNKVTIIFFGVRNLNVGLKLSENIYKELVDFETDMIKMIDVRFRLESVDREAQKEESCLYESFGSFIDAFNERAARELYQTLVAATFMFEMKNKMNNSVCTKKLNLVFLDAINIENYDRFARQFKATLNKEKIITVKDKSLESIEGYIRGANRFLMIAELPNLIRKGEQAQEEYSRLRNVLDIMARVKK